MKDIYKEVFLVNKPYLLDHISLRKYLLPILESKRVIVSIERRKIEVQPTTFRFAKDL